MASLGRKHLLITADVILGGLFRLHRMFSDMDREVEKGNSSFLMFYYAV
ncbi:hypothetical protein [Sphingobacterium athyrii]|nr:hypothetical protein [Sphingobacterium athyrii]